MSEQKKTQAKTITLDAKLVKTVEEQASRENRNFSNMVETLLLQATSQYGII